MRTNLKGFEHAGHAWSWPEFDESGLLMTRAGHALDERSGRAACGADWPHVWTGDPETSTGYVPSRAIRDEVRDAEDRSVYLCGACCRSLSIARGEEATRSGSSPSASS